MKTRKHTVKLAYAVFTLPSFINSTLCPHIPLLCQGKLIFSIKNRKKLTFSIENISMTEMDKLFAFFYNPFTFTHSVTGWTFTRSHLSILRGSFPSKVDFPLWEPYSSLWRFIGLGIFQLSGHSVWVFV